MTSQLTPATIRQMIRTYILDDLMAEPTYPLRDDEPILSSYLLDSFSLASIGVYIDQTFDVYIPDPELTVEKMDTLDQIVARTLQSYQT